MMFGQFLRALYLEADYQSWRSANAVSDDGSAARYRFFELRVVGLI